MHEGLCCRQVRVLIVVELSAGEAELWPYLRVKNGLVERLREAALPHCSCGDPSHDLPYCQSEQQAKYRGHNLA